MKPWISKLLVLVMFIGCFSGVVWPRLVVANTALYNEALKEGDIVIDNVESDYVTFHTGSSADGWSNGASGGHYGSNYALGHFNRPKDMYVEYKPASVKALEPGYYEVYVSYRRASNISNQVPVEIYHNQGYDIEVVNQRNTNANSYGRVGKGNGEWDLLGIYFFNGDQSEYVRVTNAGTGTNSSSYVVADAVRFSPRKDIVDASPAPLDVTLKGLVVDEAELVPEFHPGKTAYSLSVGKELHSIQITATVSEAVYTSLTIGGSPAVTGQPLVVPIQPGANTIPIVVSANKVIETDDGFTTLQRELVYSLNVDKAKNDDVTLSSLIITPGEMTLLSDTVTTTTYEAQVGLDVDTIQLTLTTQSPVSSLTVNGEGTASGEPYEVEVRYGLNTISIIVIAENGTTMKEYIILVIREASQGDVTGPGNQPDGRYSIADLGFVSYHYGATSASPDWADIQIADMDNNGAIDESDVLFIANLIE